MGTPVKLKDEIFEWFMHHPIATLKDCADHFEMSYETVRGWGKEEGWYQERLKRSELGELPESVVEQAGAIRLVLVRRIVLGLELAPGDLSELVKTWESITSIGAVEDPGIDRDSILEQMTQ